MYKCPHACVLPLVRIYQKKKIACEVLSKEFPSENGPYETTPGTVDWINGVLGCVQTSIIFERFQNRFCLVYSITALFTQYKGKYAQYVKLASASFVN